MDGSAFSSKHRVTWATGELMTEALADICFNSEKTEVSAEQLQQLSDDGADFVKAEKNGWSALYLLCRYDPKLNVEKLQIFRSRGVVDYSVVGGPIEMPETVEFEHLIAIWKFVKA